MTTRAPRNRTARRWRSTCARGSPPPIHSRATPCRRAACCSASSARARATQSRPSRARSPSPSAFAVRPSHSLPSVQLPSPPPRPSLSVCCFLMTAPTGTEMADYSHTPDQADPFVQAMHAIHRGDRACARAASACVRCEPHGEEGGATQWWRRARCRGLTLGSTRRLGASSPRQPLPATPTPCPTCAPAPRPARIAMALVAWLRAHVCLSVSVSMCACGWLRSDARFKQSRQLAEQTVVDSATGVRLGRAYRHARAGISLTQVMHGHVCGAHTQEAQATLALKVPRSTFVCLVADLDAHDDIRRASLSLSLSLSPSLSLSLCLCLSVFGRDRMGRP
jgi:hypothetical protein